MISVVMSQEGNVHNFDRITKTRFILLMQIGIVC